METIFHEKQEGSLCAQHCLNALLQGHYFTAVDLAAIGQQLDESERETMAEAGIHSEEYRKFLEQPSSNYDDSGFFSVQVIQNALRVWSLEQIPFKSSDPVAVNAQQDPTKMKAFICNFKEHWFCVRKLGNQWFNLNSLLTGPELISDTYLAIFLAQLQQEGYSIFIILGSLPDCEADQLLRLMPAVQPVKPQLLTDAAKGQEGQGQDAVTGEEDQDEIARVLEESRQMQNDAEALELEAAIALSMQGSSQTHHPKPGSSAVPGPSTPRDQPHSAPGQVSDTQPTVSELREKRLAYLQNMQGPATQNRPTTEASQTQDEKTEDELLQEAIKISLQSPK